MRIRLLGLVALAALAGRAAAGKPPDLPDNPPIIVAPVQAPWLAAPAAIFPAPPAEPEYEIALTADGERLMRAAILLGTHPFLTFVPAEPCVARWCGQPPATGCSRVPTCTPPTRTVLENLEALEKASGCLGRAEEMARQGKFAEAVAALEEAQKLVPGSPCAERAELMLKAVCAAGKVTRGDCEEAEEGATFAWRVPHFLAQLGMCEVNGLCERCEKAVCHAPHLMRPITLHCDNTPLRVVLGHLRELCGVEIVVEHGVCLDRPVRVHAERTPVCTVLEMVLRPMGYAPCVRGQVVRVRGEKPCCAKGGEECCDAKCCKDADGPKLCGGSACPKCDKLHTGRKPDVDDLVTYLLKGCYLAIEQERYEIAADLARQAKSLDPMRVEGDPVVYKFSLLGECGAHKPCPHSCPGACQPSNNYPAQKQCGEDLSLRPKSPVGETIDAVVVSNEACKAQCPKCAKVTVKVREVRTGNVVYGVGVNSDAGLTGSVVLNERNFDCCRQGSVFTKVLRTHGREWAKAGADVLAKLYVAEPIPDDSREGCLTLGLSSSGVVNVYCRVAHEGKVYNATLKDGLFLIWTKPAKGEKAE